MKVRSRVCQHRLNPLVSSKNTKSSDEKVSRSIKTEIHKSKFK